VYSNSAYIHCSNNVHIQYINNVHIQLLATIKKNYEKYMKFETTNITSIGDLVEKLKAHIENTNQPIWFRGQANSEWDLEPKLMRINPLPSESHLLNKFKQNATFILDKKPDSEFEWLFLMQHYGMSTRLLDWSESPLVSLYFALNGDEDSDSALWILLPTELNKLSRFRPDFEDEIPSFEDVDLENYLPSRIAGERKSSLLPMAAIAVRNNPRIQAQQGVFTISHRENILINSVSEEGEQQNHIWKYVIPKESKKEMLAELELLGVSKFQLFPELESLSQNIM
jgi:hypothetical protein